MKKTPLPMLLALAAIGLASCGGTAASESSVGSAASSETTDETLSSLTGGSSSSIGGTADSSSSAGPAGVESVSVEPSALDLAFGKTATLSATVLPDDAEDKAVVWSSADEEVATVSEEGLVIATGVGETTVSATAANGVAGTAAVTVTDENTYLSLVEDELAGMWVGDAAEAFEISGMKSTAYGVTLASSSDAVVIEDGALTAAKEGEALLTISDAEGMVLASASVYVYESEAFALEAQDDGTYWYTGYTGAYETLALPSAYEGAAVTGIGDRAFQSTASVTRLVLPKEMQTIGNYAFDAGSSIAELTFNSGSRLTQIGNYAFRNCASVKEAALPDGITTLGTYIFRGCSSIEKAFVPASITEMGTGLFYDCASLADVTLEEGLALLGANMFYGCPALSSIEIPESVVEMGNGPFAGCTGLTSVKLPSGLTSLPSSLFNGCSNLSEIIMTKENMGTEIGSSVFRGTAIASFEIPNTIASIGTYAFYGCTKLASLTFEEGSVLTSIGNNAFQGDTSLTRIELPSSLTSIGTNLFNGCSALEEVTFGEGVSFASLGTSTFNGCSALTTVEIPGSVTTIGNTAFANCTGLESIVIPKSVISMGNNAFQNCDPEKLVIYCEATEEEAGGWSSTWNSSGCRVVWGYSRTFGELSGTYSGDVTMAYGGRTAEGSVSMTFADASTGTLDVSVPDANINLADIPFSYVLEGESLSINVSSLNAELSLTYDADKDAISGSFALAGMEFSADSLTKA